MSVRHIRILLWTCTAVLGVAAVLVGVLGLRSLDQPIAAASPSGADGLVQTNDRHVPELALDSLGRHWGVRLQRPLYDPAVVDSGPARRPLELRLMGTVIEPGNEQVILMDSSGRIRFARVGDTLEQATIQAIAPTSVQLQYHGQQHTLEVEQR